MNFSVGTKFVVKQKRGMRKQFLVVDDEPLLVFVEKKGKKFTDCQSYEDRQDVGGELLSVYQNRPRPLGWGLLLRSDY